MSQQFAPGFGIRRSATLPTKLMPERRSLGGEAQQQEGEPVLFFHPSAKIVKFAPDAPPATPQSAPSADFDYPVDTIETLPWQSPTERTVAVGRLRLEMVPGLSPFLKCGTVVQAILKNSQCWCVDGKSTFVLRIRSLTYYRIELPNGTPEEETLVGQFKSALPKVLRYEVTPCPFQRGFSVPLPAEAHLPKKKRAWRPKHHRRDSAPAASDSDIARLNTNNALDTSQRPRTAEASDSEATDDSASTTTNSVSQPEPASSEDVQESSTNDIIAERRNSETRSVTEPASTIHDILARFQPIPESDNEDDENDAEDDTESFYSTLSPEIKDPPSPSYTSPPASPPDNQLQDLPIPRHRPSKHNRDISTATITPESIAPVIQVSTEVERLNANPEVPKETETSEDHVHSSMPSEPEFSEAPIASTTGTETIAASFDETEVSQHPIESSVPSEPEVPDAPTASATRTETPTSLDGKHFTTVSDVQKETQKETEDAPQDHVDSSTPSEPEFSDASIISATEAEAHSTNLDGTETSEGPVDSSTPSETEIPDAPAASVTGTETLSTSLDGKHFTTASEAQKETGQALEDQVGSSTPSEPEFSDAPTTPVTRTEALSTSLDVKDDSSLTLRRGQSTRKRALSPLPPASTLEYAKPQPSKTDLTTMIFHKTCSLVLVPPLQLLLLLIHIASRIVAGNTPPAAALLDGKVDTQEDDDSDYQMPKTTPGTFRRSLLLGDPSDSLSDLE